MYFFELSEQYTTKAWYFALRGVVNIGLGLAAWLAPQFTADVLVMLFAAWLIGNSAVQIVPIVAGRRTRHLWPQALASGVIGLVVGVLALASDTLTLGVTAFIFGVMLVFRAALDVTIFVEAPMRARHQRLLLLGAVVSFVAGVVLLSSPFSDQHAFEKLLGVYVLVIGGIHILNAWRISETIEASETQAHTLPSHVPAVPVESPEEDTPAPPRDLSPPELEPSWNPAVPGSRLDLSKYRRPIVLAPHPDDLEAFAGGLVRELDVGVISVVFAGGDKGVWSQQYAGMNKTDYVRVRLSESAEAARLLGITEIVYMGFLDRGVACSPAAVAKVLELFEHHRPDLVVSFEFYPRANPYPHPDHMAAAEIVRQAIACYVRTVQPRPALDYLVTSTLIPNVFVDVTGVRRVKLEALACHTTQAGLNGIIFPFLEKLITKLWGAFTGVDYAEGYRLVNIPAMLANMKVDDTHERPCRRV